MDRIVSIAFVLALCGAASAQQATPDAVLESTLAVPAQASDASQAVNASSPWTLEIHPCVWYLGFSGDVTMPSAEGDSDPVDLDEFDLTSPRLSPYAEATLRKGRWMVGLRGFVFGTDQDATVNEAANFGNTELAPGTRVRSSLDVTGFELEGGYTVWLNERSAMTGGGYKLRTRVDAIAGVRFMTVDFDSALLPAIATDALESPQSADVFTVQPLIGARMAADFYEQFSIILELSIGAQPFGDDASYGFDIIVGGQWRPIEHVGVQIGYRSLFLGVSSGSDNEEFELTGAAQGLYAGVTFSF